MEELTPEEYPGLGRDQADLGASYKPESVLARQAKVQERRALVLSLKKKGATAEAIIKVAFEKGLCTEKYGPQQVANDFSAAMQIFRSRSREDVRDLQNLEGFRLDHMFSRLSEGINRGIPSAVNCGVLISKQRATLFGLSEDFQISVEEQVAGEVEGILDLLELELTSDEYHKVLTAIAGRAKVNLDDRIQTVDIQVTE